MDISLYSLGIWFVSLLIASLGVVVFTGGNNRSSRMFLITVILMALWTASVGAFISATSVELATFLVKLCYFWGSAIGVFFLFFFIVYPYDQPIKEKLVYTLAVSLVAYGYLFFFTDLIISRAFPLGGIARYGWQFGLLWPLFYLIFYGCFLSGFVILFRKTLSAKSREDKQNMRYIFWGILVLISPPTLVNIVMPQFGRFELIWLGPLMSIGWVSVVAYSIVRHRQMNIKIFTAEVLALVMAIVFFVNIFTNVSLGASGRVGLFVVFLILGYFLIRSVIRESNQSDILKNLNLRLKNFNLHLQEKVDEQTKKIKKSYEVERQARLELEKLNETKNQFVVITEHHLRTPLTSIRWYLESLLGGSYGGLSPQVTEALSGVKTSAERLTMIINNFLDITEIKAGKDILNITPVRLKPMLFEVLEELSDATKHMKLEVRYSKDDAAWPPVLVDTRRFKEVLFIVLDNAVRYNKSGGYISVATQIVGDKLLLTVENPGVGVSQSEQKHLFSDLFQRGEAAKKIHPNGMGVGLALARSIVEAHKGNIRLESSGEGGMVKVLIELPLP